jgi:hypothetical protein
MKKKEQIDLINNVEDKFVNKICEKCKKVYREPRVISELKSKQNNFICKKNVILHIWN